MGSNTKIDWAEASWNPVTGCYHDCPYCYAADIARRFGGHDPETEEDREFDEFVKANGPVSLHYLGDRRLTKIGKDGKRRYAPYPFGFEPTFHGYRLDIPQDWKESRTVFVCSMADLFGEWMLEERILDVFAACEKAMQHRYLFLTKNPKRLLELAQAEKLPNHSNFWFGTTVTAPEQAFFYETPFFTNESRSHSYGIFLSIEPIQKDFPVREKLSAANIKRQFGFDWMIVGAETGNRKGKTIPKREWIEHLMATSDNLGVPLFMKDSLRELMGGDFRQDFPWK